MKRIRLTVHDSPVRHRDDILRATSIGKQLALGRTWTGELEPLIDMITDPVTPLVPPAHVLGSILHAEPAPETLNLGDIYIGVDEALTAVRGAVRDAEGAGGPLVDLTEVKGELERLYAEMGIAPDAEEIADGLRRLRRAADRVTASRTGDAAGLIGMNARTRSAVADMQAANERDRPARTAAQPRTTSTRDTSLTATALRDAEAAITRAAKVGTRELLEAMNARHRVA